MTTPKEFAKPEGLSADGEKAYAAIAEFLRERDLLWSGGCKVFYSPEEWRKRGEKYGLTSELVIVHDGGDHAAAFSYDHEQYKVIDALRERLLPLGLYAEQCTSWYSAIYCS